MKKKLLVFGCSYADKSYVEITTKSEKLKEHIGELELKLDEIKNQIKYKNLN